jgi:hypothetical protein
MSYTNKEHGVAAQLAASNQTWRTYQTVGAGDGVHVPSLELPIQGFKMEPELVTDVAHTQRMRVFNHQATELEWFNDEPFYNNTTAASVIEQWLMALLYAATNATQQGATAAWLHAGSEIGTTNHAMIQITPQRWFTIVDKLAKASGSSIRHISSVQPTGFELSLESDGKAELVLKGMGTKVVLDNATTTTDWDSVTYTDQSLRLKFHHAYNYILFEQYDTDAGSAATFASPGQAVHPKKMVISLDWGMEAVHTDASDVDQPRSKKPPEIKVVLTFHKMPTDALYTKIDTALAAWGPDTLEMDKYFHFLARFTYPVAIASTHYPYFEIGCPMLSFEDPASVKRAIEAGTETEIEIPMLALEPTSATAIPAGFLTAGGGTGSGCLDPIYIAIMSKTNTAIIA